MFARYEVIRTILLVLAAFVSTIGTSQSEAQSVSQNCEAHRWPYSQNVSRLKVQDLEAANRVALYSYLYYELTKQPAGRIDGLAKQLMFFLKNTELNNDRALMLEAVEFAAGLDTPNPTVFTLEELCRIDRRAASVRSPVRAPKKRK